MAITNYAALPTEQFNPRSRQLDCLSSRQIVALMNREDHRVLQSIAAAQTSIADAVDLIVGSLSKGGRLFFVGAGTSGRLGILEAAECPPTFNTRPRDIRALMAGGRSAVFRSKEGAEDSALAARKAVAGIVGRGDVVVGIAASGVTPYVQAAIEVSRRRGAYTILVTCNPASARKTSVNVGIGLKTGPEILTGSTRLKAGTACKMVLNMLTTASMVRLGKVYGNTMVDLQPKSKKLVARGLRLIEMVGAVGPQEAQRLFTLAQRRVKVAILMAREKCSAGQARRRLRSVEGNLRKALAS